MRKNWGGRCKEEVRSIEEATKRNEGKGERNNEEVGATRRKERWRMSNREEGAMRWKEQWGRTYEGATRRKEQWGGRSTRRKEPCLSVCQWKKMKHRWLLGLVPWRKQKLNFEDFFFLSYQNAIQIVLHWIQNYFWYLLRGRMINKVEYTAYVAPSRLVKITSYWPSTRPTDHPMDRRIIQWTNGHSFT